MEELNEVQFQILDSVYFVEPFDNILQEVDHPMPVVRDELRTMIDKGWIQVMEFVEERGDYRRTPIFDTDNMQDYAYLATKEGLLRHNGM
ncbi:MAG: hypothetical protein AAGI38_13770 [Bacteroidota bacterium]